MFREIGVIFIQLFCDISHIYIVLLLSFSSSFSFSIAYILKEERENIVLNVV